MKVIDCAVRDRDGQKPGLLKGLKNNLDLFMSRDEIRAQKAVVSVLRRVLDNRFFLLRNVYLEEADVNLQMVLAGPAGLRVLQISLIKGIYRAKEDQWEVLEDRTRRFKIARPNLLTQTLLMAQALEKHLNSSGFQISEIEPVLIFADPGVHVDMTRPVTRVVLSDAIDRFAASLLSLPAEITPDLVQRVVDRLLGGHSPELSQVPVMEERDAFSFMDLPQESRPRQTVVVDRSEPQVLKKVPFSRRQWGLLAFLVLVNIVILAAFVAFILVSN